jgi:hypothetical protein
LVQIWYFREVISLQDVREKSVRACLGRELVIPLNLVRQWTPFSRYGASDKYQLQPEMPLIWHAGLKNRPCARFAALLRLFDRDLDLNSRAHRQIEHASSKDQTGSELE